jgi:hypothetical protein
MHKAGGVLSKHPPALCGLTRYSDYGGILETPIAPVHANLASNFMPMDYSTIPVVSSLKHRNYLSY